MKIHIIPHTYDTILCQQEYVKSHVIVPDHLTFGAPEGTRTHTLKAQEPKGDVTLVKDFFIEYSVESFL